MIQIQCKLYRDYRRYPSCNINGGCHPSSSVRPWGTIRSNSIPLSSEADSNNGDWEIQNCRSFLARSALSTISLYTFPANITNARGLVRFPCNEPLLNTYHVLRTGSSLLELEDVWSTNPLFLTNQEAALS